MLARIRSAAHLLQGDAGQWAEDMAMMGPKDALILIAFRPLMRLMPAILDWASTSRSSLARPQGRYRCVDRCSPSKLQTRLSETRNRKRTWAMQAWRREGVFSGLWRLFAIFCPPFPIHNGGPVQMGGSGGLRVCPNETAVTPCALFVSFGGLQRWPSSPSSSSK